MKPIEEGCLAMVINSLIDENNGLCVTVGKFLGDKKNIKEERLWEVDRPLIYRVLHNGIQIGTNEEYFCPERCLIRLDDFDEEIEKIVDRELIEA